jgi:hypothetical protein
VQGFYRNVNGIYQFIPCFKAGSQSLTSSYVNVVAVEPNSYGQIWMFKNDNSDNVAMAFFQAGTTTWGMTCHHSWHGTDVFLPATVGRALQDKERSSAALAEWQSFVA